MKIKKNALLLFTFVLLYSFNTVQARLRVPFGNKEVLEKVAELPDKPKYELSEGSNEYMDLGRLHTELNFLWLPLYIVKEPKIVGINRAKDAYYDLSEEELKKILKENNLNKEDLLKLGFFTSFGGKLVGIILLLLIIYGYWPSKPKKVDPKHA